MRIASDLEIHASHEVLRIGERKFINSKDPKTLNVIIPQAAWIPGKCRRAALTRYRYRSYITFAQVRKMLVSGSVQNHRIHLFTTDDLTVGKV